LKVVFGPPKGRIFRKNGLYLENFEGSVGQKVGTLMEHAISSGKSLMISV
jgi:hypothetical protein